MSPKTITAPPPNARTSFENREPSVEENAAFRLPFWFWAIAGALVIWGAFTANPVLTPVAILILVSLIQLLWRPGEPPVLVFACGMQWLQAAAVIFYTDFYRVSVAQAGGSVQFETATWLSLIAVFALGIGMRVALFRCRPSQHAEVRSRALRVDIGNAFVAYLVCFVIALVVERFAFAVPAITQPIGGLITLKWVAVFILTYSILEQRKGYIFLIAVVLIEVAVGLTGFFASFKSVFFVLLVVGLTSPLALRGRRLAITLAVAVTLFVLSVVWSAIKAEYRDFLNQGSDQQEILVSVDESVIKLGEIVANFTWHNFTDGLDKMILRIGYTNYFALTLLNVPDSVPYEHGALWLGALKQVVTPRLLFPDKAAISDSDRTTMYTGIFTAGEERGTSIGIGYVAESYVDFGPILMFAPIFLLGMFFGLIYRFFVIQSDSKLICTAIASAILIFNGNKIETSNIKIVGGTVVALLSVGTIYLFFGKAFRTWLERGLK